VRRARGRDAPPNPAAHDARVSQNLAEIPPEAAGRQGLVVILVEDDEGLRAALVRVLRAWGFETRAYASGEDALADPALDWPACLVVDLNLPAMSGLDLIDRLRERGVTAPAVVISAQEEAKARGELQRRGIRHFLPKPFLGSALVRAVDAVLGERLGGGIER
jgi:FixJ family two-component response regulator